MSEGRKANAAFMGEGRPTVQPVSFSVIRPFASAGAGRKLLDENAHGSPVVEGDAGAFDLAKTGSAARDFLDEAGLTKTHLTDTLAEIFVALDLANAAGSTGTKLAKGKNRWTRERHVIET